MPTPHEPAQAAPKNDAVSSNLPDGPPADGLKKALASLRNLALDCAERPYLDCLLGVCAAEDTAMRRALYYAATHAAAGRGERARTASLFHAMRVAGILAKEFAISDPDMISAALLHDVLAEHDGDVEEIEREFGDTVADYLVLLTPPQFFPKAERARLYEEGLQSAPEEVLLIKLAEVYDDLRFRRPREGARIRAAMTQLLEGIVRHRRIRSNTRRAIELVQQLMRTPSSTHQSSETSHHRDGLSSDLRSAA